MQGSALISLPQVEKKSNTSVPEPLLGTAHSYITRTHPHPQYISCISSYSPCLLDRLLLPLELPPAVGPVLPLPLDPEVVGAGAGPTLGTRQTKLLTVQSGRVVRRELRGGGMVDCLPFG